MASEWVLVGSRRLTSVDGNRKRGRGWVTVSVGHFSDSLAVCLPRNSRSLDWLHKVAQSTNPDKIGSRRMRRKDSGYVLSRVDL